MEKAIKKSVKKLQKEVNKLFSEVAKAGIKQDQILNNIQELIQLINTHSALLEHIILILALLKDKEIYTEEELAAKKKEIEDEALQTSQNNETGSKDTEGD